ncbi:hypothetical protein N0V82_007935 [Gnomoniopsis sp. IMI 355080]|nr:hypothetical protein N0V82_007935 [Gnomoniopsis sp. IMI 355080]
MGFRLRPRLLTRCWLAVWLLALLILSLLLGQRYKALVSVGHWIPGHSTAHELVSAISHTKRMTSTDASQPQFAQALCRELGLQIFDKKPVPRPGTGSSKRKVYDLFIIDIELDWMQIRLNSTYDFVDYFVIIEARKSSTGQEKPLILRDNWDRFSAYHDKIIYHEMVYPIDFSPEQPWDFEDLQRNALFTQVFPHLTGEQSPTQGDVLLVADVDELVRPEALLVLRACEIPRRLTIHSELYYYSFQYLHRGLDWPHPQATTYQGLSDTILPSDLRKEDGERHWGYLAPVIRWPEKDDLWNGGWHCSSCLATVDEVLQKVESFSHVFLNARNYRDQGLIAV